MIPSHDSVSAEVFIHGMNALPDVVGLSDVFSEISLNFPVIIVSTFLKIRDLTHILFLKVPCLGRYVL